MTTDINPYRALSANITPTDFEIFCMNTLEAYAEREKLPNFSIKHNQKVEAYDGTYQIDVLAEYTALGTQNAVLIECKKQSRSVERDEVSNLYDKVKSIGAQKGILISTAGFQSGAVQYAKIHGIALWQICDIFIKHISNSISYPTPDMMKYQFLVEQRLPKHFMMEWDCDADYPYTQIYPTDEMLKNARERIREDYYA